MKRYPRGRRQSAVSMAGALLFMLSVPFCLLGLRGTADYLPQAAEGLLVLSVISASPSQSLSLLEERFLPQRTADNPTIAAPLPELSTVPTEQQESADPPESDAAEVWTSPVRRRKEPPEIPEEYRAPLISKSMAGYDGGFLSIGSGYLRNDTQLSNEEVLTILEEPCKLKLLHTNEPQVLIFHTHATESYEPYDREYYDTRGTWRSTDNGENMVAVGNALENALTAKGIGVVHDTTQHDYPSYNGSYNRSAQTVQSYLQKYPSIKIVLDIHRDATQSGDEIIKPITKVNGHKAAQVMIIAPCDDGTMNIPRWRENLRFAAALQNCVEEQYPTLTRPLFFCYRKYNMHLSDGALLLEFGSHGNTLEEAEYTAALLGECLGDYLNSTMNNE